MARIGARLYLALGFAVALTLVSAAVGVYYFEQSGELNHQVQSESVPALEGSWIAARESERLRALGLAVVAESESGFQGLESGAVAYTLGRLEAALDEVSGVPEFTSDAQAANDAAVDLAEVIDKLALKRNDLLRANEVASDYRLRLTRTTSDIGGSEAALSVLRQMLQTDDEVALEGLWNEFANLYAKGIDPVVASLGEGELVFSARRQQLA